jgi:RNA polymerase sigma factor (sigma-70 family)
VVRAGAAGEAGALDGLLRAVFPTARRFAARSCSSREDAEDAVQDALTALVRRVGALRAAETVTSWLFVTIRNACLRRVPGVILVPVDAVPETARPDIASAVVDRLVVADALAALPAAQRDVVVLVDLLGLPAERAAQRLGIGVRATKSRLHRARRALAVVSDRRHGKAHELAGRAPEPGGGFLTDDVTGTGSSG